LELCVQQLQVMTATNTPPLFSFIARKGGVGKSTCSALIARTYAASGLRVAVVDCDPQGTTTNALLRKEDIDGSRVDEIGKAMRQGDSLQPFLQSTVQDGLSIVPAQEVLTVHAEVLGGDKLGVFKVKQSLESLVTARFDLVIVDTPGSYGVLTFGALAAARWAIVPTYCQKPSAAEVPKALKAIFEAQAVNPGLRLLAIIANKLDSRTRHELGVLETLRQAFPKELVEPPIPSATAITNAMAPNAVLETNNAGLSAIVQVAEELLRRHAEACGRPVESELRRTG